MGTVSGDRHDWSSLNYDLTDHIFTKYLTFSDLLRCRNVCRSWRSVSHTIVSSFPVNSPILLFPRHYLPQQMIIPFDEESHHSFSRYGNLHKLWLFNPAACELYKLGEKSKNLFEERSFIGSSKGWALFKGGFDLVLFNAPTGISIRMPCPITDSLPIKKAVLWGGDPILDTKRKNNSSSHGIVAIKKDWSGNISRHRVTFCLWGDTRFKNTLQDVTDPCDVIYFDGLVYVILKKGLLQAWDFNQREICFIGRRESFIPTKVEHYLPSFNPGKELTDVHKLRLVDSSGELWLVSKIGTANKSKIGVYKMDFKERKWVDKNSLGDGVVVLFKNQSIAFSPLGPSKYKRNCVYFEDYDPATYRGIYVYNMVDASITKSILCVF